jgi:hypothetical protein
MDPKDMGQAGWTGLLGQQQLTFSLFFYYFISNLV